MARVLAAALLLAGLAACAAGKPRTNVARPATPVTLTAAVHERFVQVSPTRVGAGQIDLVVSNQTGRSQTVTFETSDVPGDGKVGRRASTPRIRPDATGRLTIDARRGDYLVHVGDRTVRVAHVTVGPPRGSAQDRLLLP
jgi:hypothetical protein